MRISDWSSDVCSSDLDLRGTGRRLSLDGGLHLDPQHGRLDDRQLRQRGAAARLPAAPAEHGAARQLLPHRAGLGIGRDRKSVVEGKRVSVRVDSGGRRIIKTKKKHW